MTNNRFIDFLVIFGGCFLFEYIRTTLIFGYEKLLDIRPGVFGMVYFGSIVSFVYFIFLKIFESKSLFLIASWSVFAFLLYQNIEGGRSSNLTLYRFGHVMYQDGEIQALGILYKIFDPVGLMVIFATVLFVNSMRKYKK